jgi:hypothetical protein
MQSLTIFSGAMVALFASLALVAVSIALLTRRYSRPALALAAIGLLGLTSAATVVAKTGTMAVMDAAPLTAVAPTATKTEPVATPPPIRLAVSAPGITPADLDRLKAKLDAAEALARDAQQDARTAKQDNTRLASQLESARGELKTVKADLEAANQRIAELKRQLDQPQVQTPQRRPEAAKLDPPTPTPTPAPSTPLRETLARWQETSSYTSEPLSKRALVTGLDGSWYVIRLKVRDQPLLFPGRQFSLRDEQASVVESARLAHKDLIGPIGQVAKRVKLFVRGSADARRIAGPTDAPVERPLTVLPRLPDGTYSAVSKKRVYRSSAPIQNDDLPNLRAGWLRDTIGAVIGVPAVSDIQILENPPGREQERTAELLMFVEWREASGAR